MLHTHTAGAKALAPALPAAFFFTKDAATAQRFEHTVAAFRQAVLCADAAFQRESGTIARLLAREMLLTSLEEDAFFTPLNDINQGTHSLVCSIKGNEAVIAKVTSPYVGNGADEGYSTWMENFALENQDNEHLPQVLLYLRLPDGASLVIMEKLATLCHVKDRKLVKELHQLETAVEVLVQATRFNADTDDVPENLSEGLMDIATYLSGVVDGEEFHEDIRHENAMRRGDVLVIIDPLYYDDGPL